VGWLLSNRPSVADGGAADQGCAVPPICCANRLPRAPLRGALRRPWQPLRRPSL